MTTVPTNVTFPEKIVVYVTKEVKKELRRLAFEDDVKVTALIRPEIDKLIKRRRGKGQLK